jgi:hypothetical protein
MTSVQATSAAAPLPSGIPGRDTARSHPTRGLAGLIDVLDRADGAGPARPIRHRSAASSRAGRPGPDRLVPPRGWGRGIDPPEPAVGSGPAGGPLGRRPAGRVPGLARRTGRRRPCPSDRGPSSRRASVPADLAGPPGGALGCRSAGRTPRVVGRPTQGRRPAHPGGRRPPGGAARAAQHPHGPARGVFPRHGACCRPGVCPR